jgi:cysteine synthase
VKDRIAVRMIQAAEESGELRAGGTIVEPTSGNTGVGLAIVAQQRGYRCVFVCPDKVSNDKIDTLRAYGAEVVVCPTAVAPDDPRSYYSVSDRLAREISGGWKPNQYSNPNNPLSHYETTGPEIWEQTGGGVTHFVAGVGTGGTISGVGRYLKEQRPEVQIVAVEPPAGELVQGLRSLDDGFVPPIFDASVLDRKTIVRNRESIEWTRRLLDECGVFAGISSGAAIAGAAKVASRMESGTIVTLLPDGGWKYLSSGAWTDDLDVVEERASRINYW